MKHILLVFYVTLALQGYAQEIDSAEIERERILWNQKLTQDTTYKFKKEPNSLLVESVKNVKPGTALDIGMGQGRNTLFLAQQRWNVTGIDIADKAVQEAEKNARAQNLTITTVLSPMETYDYGVNKWDLVVRVYEGCPDQTEMNKIQNALKPGGLFVFEFFHREAGIEMNRPQFGCEKQSVKKLVEATSGMQIKKYSEEYDIADYGLLKCKLVKLIAIKK